MVETLVSLMERHSAARGDACAFECRGRRTTFRQLHANAWALATVLAACGVLPGSRIGYLGRNSDRYFELLFGAALAGAVMVPIGWRSTVPEIEYLVDDAGISILFCEPEFVEAARQVACGRGMALVSTEQEVAGAVGYEAWRGAAAAEGIRLPAVDPGAPVLQLYTSGTTGRPKGAVLAQANFFPLRPLCAAAGLAWDRWHPEDVSLQTMPVAHVAGTGWGLVAFYNGARSIIMPDFDAGAILRAISTEQISRIFLVPTALQAVLRHPDIATSDFSRLRFVLYGASPIPLDLLREAVATFGCDFVQNYGMTETCGTVVALGPEDHDPRGSPRMAAAGKALPGVELRVVDEQLKPVGLGITGEILVRSPTTMIGYWQQPAATADALVDGWMRTGDAGYLDRDGYLFVQDRLKDTIISGGENVYPAEVESVLYAHPEVGEVAVIGVPDPRWGEAVTAIVVPAGQSVDVPGLLAWARERLAAYKVPKTVILRDGLPRNASGKVLRRELREPFWAVMARQVN